MRTEQVNDVIERLPSHVASFDDAGIRAGVNQLNAAGLVQDFAEIVRTDIAQAKKIFSKIWNMSPQAQTAMADIAKYNNAYNSTIKSLPANPTPGQVVDAVINFWKTLLH